MSLGTENLSQMPREKEVVLNTNGIVEVMPDDFASS